MEYSPGTSKVYSEIRDSPFYEFDPLSSFGGEFDQKIRDLFKMKPTLDPIDSNALKNKEIEPLTQSSISDSLFKGALKALSFFSPSRLKSSQVAVSPESEKTESMTHESERSSPLNSSLSEIQIDGISDFDSKPVRKTNLVLSVVKRETPPPIPLKDLPLFPQKSLEREDFLKKHPRIQEDLNAWHAMHTEIHRAGSLAFSFKYKNEGLMATGYSKNQKNDVGFLRNILDREKAMLDLFEKTRNLETAIKDPLLSVDEQRLLRAEVRQLKQLLLLEKEINLIRSGRIASLTNRIQEIERTLKDLRLDLKAQQPLTSELKELKQLLFSEKGSNQNLTFANAKKLKDLPELNKTPDQLSNKKRYRSHWERICDHFGVEEDVTLKWKNFKKNTGQEIAGYEEALKSFKKT